MDNFFTKWFRPSVREVPGVPSTTNPNAPSNQPAEPKVGDWKEQIILPSGRRSLLVPAWFRGVSLIMQTMGQMRIQYQRKDSEGGNFIEDRYGEARKLNYLLQVRPNPLMTASQMQSQIEFRKIYFGNAFVYIERNVPGWPINLWLATGGGYDPMSNTYNLTYNGTHGPRMLVEVDANDVLHFKNIILTDDYYMGVPTLFFAMKTLSIAATADEQALKDVAKGGKQKILIQEQKANPGMVGTYGRVNQQELKKATEKFNEDWLSHDAVMLDNVADAKIFSQTAAELKLLETRGFEVSDIARILGVPRIMMMEEQGSSYKMPEHATQEFLLRTIQPRIREAEDEFNSKMLTADDFGKRRIHVCELALRRLDAKGQAEIDKIHLETGWSPNQILAQYDLPQIPEGDAHYVSTNLAEVGSEKLRAVSGGSSTAAPAEPDEEEGGEQ